MNPDTKRRAFLGSVAAFGGALLAPGIHLIEVGNAAPSQGADAKVRWGLLIDTTKCAPGCNDCVTACNTENGLQTDNRATTPQWIRKVEIKEINESVKIRAISPDPMTAEKTLGTDRKPLAISLCAVKS